MHGYPEELLPKAGARNSQQNGHGHRLMGSSGLMTL